MVEIQNIVKLCAFYTVVNPNSSFFMKKLIRRRDPIRDGQPYSLIEIRYISKVRYTLRTNKMTTKKGYVNYCFQSNN
jgi:hypothetical protein